MIKVVLGYLLALKNSSIKKYYREPIWTLEIATDNYLIRKDYVLFIRIRYKKIHIKLKKLIKFIIFVLFPIYCILFNNHTKISKS